MAKKRLSRDQKRKAKLSERTRRQRDHQPESQAYTGNAFKKPEYTPIFLHTETGIGEADVITGRKLTDRQVALALSNLVGEIRDGTFTPYSAEEEISYRPGEESALISHMIRRNWSILFEKHPQPTNEVLVGILRTLLSSVDTWSTGGSGSRGYLSFLIGFLRKGGVSIQVRTDEGIVEEGEDDDPLAELGETWLEYRSVQARHDFYGMANEMIGKNEGKHVAEVAQQLLGASNDPELQKELSRISVAAQRGTRLPMPE